VEDGFLICCERPLFLLTIKGGRWWRVVLEFAWEFSLISFARPKAALKMIEILENAQLNTYW